jgi:SRSO17 transposase
VLFDELMCMVAGRFARAEPRRTAREFVLGLGSPAERKNCWWLAGQGRHADPRAMQRLLRTAARDADGVGDDVRAFAAGQLGQPGGWVVCDETGFLEKGTGPAGVQRQDAGTAGRIENSRLGVFLSYASARGRALIDCRYTCPGSGPVTGPGALRRPSWPTWRSRPGPALAMDMITGAVAAGMPAARVAYGHADLGDGQRAEAGESAS